LCEYFITYDTIVNINIIGDGSHARN